MSYTFTLSDQTSILRCTFNPPIRLDTNSEYALGLTNFESYNTIPNIEKGINDTFYYGLKREVVEIPEGTYKISELNKYIQKTLSSDKWSETKDIFIHKYLQKPPAFADIKKNNYTLMFSVKCSQEVDFSKTDSIGTLLGFKPRK